MIKNYLLISFRSLKKHFSYSVINIFGLGLGLATCILLVTWIRHELSYDSFNTKAPRIYRASLEYSFGGQVARTAVSPNALLPALLSLPETETGVRVYNPSASNPLIVKYEDRRFQENDFFVADSTFFHVFTYRLLQGNTNTALSHPYSIILTASKAKKYFGDADPIGKVLQINNKQDYTVTGIIEDAPANSILQFGFIASFSSIRAGREKPTWWSANYQTFMLLHPGANLEALEEKTNAIAKEAVHDQLTGANDYVRYLFMPLTDIHLHSDLQNEPGIVTDIKYVYIFAAIAILILAIACINYVNLATARAADRAREVGIRKVVGALRIQLFAQFVGESLLITVFAFCFAFVLAILLLPMFNALTGKSFTSNILLQPSFVATALAGVIIIALLSGAYPALAISSFKPVSVLKGSFKTSARGIWLRKSLVVVQFSVAVILITSTLVIVRQLDFIQAKKLGYDRENTIMLPLDGKTSEQFDALRTELTRTGAALHIGRGSESPTNIQAGYSVSTDIASQGIITAGLLADEAYLPAVGVELIAGRNFTQEDLVRLEKDTVYTYIVNEAALAALYIDPDKAVGTRVSTTGRSMGEIIGVIRNFHFSSLHNNIAPLVIFPEEQQFNKIFIKMPAGDVGANIERVRNIYTALIQHRPFEFEFLDEQYAALYTNEQRMGSVFIVFAALTIVIACLGLLGLVSFSAAQKTKEIGVRKVMGATAVNIVLLITKDFAKLVLIAIVFGLPIACWMMWQWLSGFAYKTDIGIWPMAAAAGISIFIALATAGYHAVKAALANPVHTLRNE